MKKLFSFIVAAALLVAGCSNSGDSTPATSTSATTSATTTSSTSAAPTSTSTASTNATTTESKVQATTAADDEPHVVQCLEGTPGPALWSDGTTAYSDWCWEQMGGAAVAEAEGNAGIDSAPTYDTPATYANETEMCAAHPEYPACNGGVDIPMTYTPTYDPNSGDGYGPDQQLPPLCQRFPSEYGPC
ncbi:membrane lipoprotein lipid attachment site-containing protein [Corynebacterium aurimucosum]|uniref:membrane lipoprotein lipid attachment site-containing protein n=1 Tax=Corynebacterium aurimucosum TaxID=169292 RepID=UPI001879AA05|nr:membrane lipoprotein lipid attachment site-containing protein [Corynebacterium aurimucosum]MBE7338091.1 membrane lipoprotein lipid attachment site-containing protein [Corynebacterium aurimucosum]